MCANTRSFIYRRLYRSIGFSGSALMMLNVDPAHHYSSEEKLTEVTEYPPAEAPPSTSMATLRSSFVSR